MPREPLEGQAGRAWAVLVRLAARPLSIPAETLERYPGAAVEFRLNL